MEATAVVDSRLSAGGAAWRRAAVPAVLAALGLGFVAAFAFRYLTLDQETLGVYWPRRGGLVLHILGGFVALMAGPVQLWLGLSGRTHRLHRSLGVVYATSIGVGSLSAYYLAATTTYGWVFGFGLASLATAWIITTTLAIVAIRRGLVEQHREWMIRSYVVTFAFVIFRMLFGVLQAAHVGTTLEQLAACSWFCWAVPLLVTESILQGKKILAVRPALPAVPLRRPL